MNHFPKSLQISSTITAIVLGAAFMAGCTITSSPVADDGSHKPAATPSSTVDGGSTSPIVGSGCDFGKPNSTREQATAIDLNRAYTKLCVAPGEDVHFYEVTAPVADVAGGVVEMQISNVQNPGLARMIVTAVADNGAIFDSYSTDPGATISGWFSMTPGAKYRIQVSRFSGSDEQFAFDLFAKYTAIVDAFAPNKRKEDAKPIAVNKPIHSTASAHSPKAQLEESDGEHWFTVSLAAGAAAVKLTDVPADYLCDVQLFDSLGQASGEKYSTTAGGACMLDATELKGGSYFVKLRPFSGNFVHGEARNAPAAYMLRSFTLEVQQ